MRQRREYLTCLALLAACAGGTMRVAEDDEEESGPVALAPTPEADPDSLPSTEPEYTSPDSVAPPPQPAPESQGYAPYGGSTGLEVRRVGQWTRTGISEARRLVIRDANAFAEFWSELGVGDRPEVDFTRNLVIVVASGQRPSGGYEVAIERVSQSNGELNIAVVETTPGPNCMTTSSLTQPVDVIVIPRVSARSWSFLERKEVRGCR